VPSKGTEPAILLPRGRARGVPPSLKVWLSNPPPRETPPADDRDYGGSYLYLVEAADQAPFGQVRTYEGRKLFVTGCSALRRVMEHARTKEELSAEEAYRNGRGDPAHPLEKLAALGAHSSLPREIEVLYQMRWMSDDRGMDRSGRPSQRPPGIPARHSRLSRVTPRASFNPRDIGDGAARSETVRLVEAERRRLLTNDAMITMNKAACRGQRPPTPGGRSRAAATAGTARPAWPRSTARAPRLP
jgi:hypothetical protein